MSKPKLNLYTVVVAVSSGVDDHYTAHVKARDPKHAIDVAEREARMEQDKEDRLEPSEYHALVVFAGHQPVVHFGWQS